HAAVSATVDLVRAGRRPRAAGYVNAVLRRVSERSLDEWVDRLAPAATADPLARLGLATAHPRWIVAALADALRAAPPHLPGEPGPDADPGRDVDPQLADRGRDADPQRADPGREAD